MKPNTNKLLPVALLQELLAYNPETGILTWRPRGPRHFRSVWACVPWNKRYAGKEAGSLSADGYRMIRFGPHSQYAHRVAWAIHTGAYPELELDHENHIKSDNSFANLLPASRSGNMKNSPLSKANTSGTTGVRFSAQIGLWVAYANVDGKRKHLGAFSHRQQAIDARAAANTANAYHPNHGT